jgi:hypothetical protein
VWHAIVVVVINQIATEEAMVWLTFNVASFGHQPNRDWCYISVDAYDSQMTMDFGIVWYVPKIFKRYISIPSFIGSYLVYLQ